MSRVPSNLGLILAGMRWCSEDDGSPLFVEHRQSDELNSGVERKAEMNWNDYFFGIMRAVAAKSKDRSAKVGAVVAGIDHEILSVGYNGFPRGVDDTVEERHERPAKYLWTEHAERNAIYNAARVGTALEGAIMYLPCPPCSRCARAIIQAGIEDVVAEMSAADFLPARSAIAWREDIELGREMMWEAGVEFEICNTPTVVYPCIEFAQPPAAICKEFAVSVKGATRQYTAACGAVQCDNCHALTAQQILFMSRADRQWTLCADRPACRSRREERQG